MIIIDRLVKETGEPHKAILEYPIVHTFNLETFYRERDKAKYFKNGN